MIKSYFFFSFYFRRNFKNPSKKLYYESYANCHTMKFQKSIQKIVLRIVCKLSYDDENFWIFWWKIEFYYFQHPELNQINFKTNRKKSWNDHYIRVGILHFLISESQNEFFAGTLKRRDLQEFFSENGISQKISENLRKWITKWLVNQF